MGRALTLSMTFYSNARTWQTAMQALQYVVPSVPHTRGPLRSQLFRTVEIRFLWEIWLSSIAHQKQGESQNRVDLHIFFGIRLLCSSGDFVSSCRGYPKDNSEVQFRLLGLVPFKNEIGMHPVTLGSGQNWNGIAKNVDPRKRFIRSRKNLAYI